MTKVEDVEFNGRSDIVAQLGLVWFVYTTTSVKQYLEQAGKPNFFPSQQLF